MAILADFLPFWLILRHWYHPIIASCHLIISSHLISSHYIISSCHHIISSYHHIISYSTDWFWNSKLPCLSRSWFRNARTFAIVSKSYPIIIWSHHIIYSYHLMVASHYITAWYHHIISPCHLIMTSHLMSSHYTILSFHHIISSYHYIISYSTCWFRKYRSPSFAIIIFIIRTIIISSRIIITTIMVIAAQEKYHGTFHDWGGERVGLESHRWWVCLLIQPGKGEKHRRVVSRSPRELHEP